MFLPIVHPAMLSLASGAAPAATGENASPSAQSSEISNRITRIRIGGKAYLSMYATPRGKCPLSTDCSRKGDHPLPANARHSVQPLVTYRE